MPPSNIYKLVDPLPKESNSIPTEPGPPGNQNNDAGSGSGSLSSLESLTMAASAIFEQNPPSFPHAPKIANKPVPMLPSIAQMLPGHFHPVLVQRQARIMQSQPPLYLQRPPIFVQSPHMAQLGGAVNNAHANANAHSQQQKIRPRPTFTFQTFKLDKRVQPESFQGAKRIRFHESDRSTTSTATGLDPAVQACIEAAKSLVVVDTGKDESSEKSEKGSDSESNSVANASTPITTVTAHPNQQQISLNFRNFSINLGARSTNLTSNQYGTATADKSHYAAVMTDSVLCTSLGMMEHFSDEYRPTVNNKLKALKFMEFLQERFQMHFCGSKSVADQLKRLPPAEQLAIVYRMPEALKAQYGHMGELHVLLRGGLLGVAIYRAKTGKRLYCSSPFTGSSVSRELDVTASASAPGCLHEVIRAGVEDGDFVITFLGNCLRVADALAPQLATIPAGMDMDEMVEALNANLTPKIGNIVSVAVFGSTFDEFYTQPHQIRHSLHTERKGLLAIDQPWAYAITKHSFLLRPYLAMIYADASKINRFCPTIEFVIRKAAAPAVMGRSLTESLKKLSEVQHMAGAMIRPKGKLRYWGTGGAFVALIDRRDAAAGSWPITFPGLDSASPALWRSDSTIPVGEVDYHVGQMIFLMCPSVRMHWKPQELTELLGRPNRTIPEKLTTLISRFTDESAFRSGIGAFEIV